MLCFFGGAFGTAGSRPPKVPPFRPRDLRFARALSRPERRDGPRPFQGLVRLGTKTGAATCVKIRLGRQGHRGGRVGIRPGPRMPTSPQADPSGRVGIRPGPRMLTQPHVSSFTRHLKGLRPVSPFRPRKRPREAQVSRPKRRDTRGPQPRARQRAKNTAPSRASPHVHLREPAHPRLRRPGSVPPLRSTCRSGSNADVIWLRRVLRDT